MFVSTRSSAHRFPRHRVRLACQALAGASAVLVLAACTPPRAPITSLAFEESAASPPACSPVPAADAMVGTWFAVSRPRGVGGNMQALTVLSADGSMTYETQLKVGKRTRPALREKGCWTVADGVYTMRTTVSNGEPVDISDPIYLNRFQVVKLDAQRLTLRELKSGGQQVTARRMQPGYRLPD